MGTYYYFYTNDCAVVHPILLFFGILAFRLYINLIADGLDLMYPLPIPDLQNFYSTILIIVYSREFFYRNYMVTH